MKRILIILLVFTSALHSQWQLRDNGIPLGTTHGQAIDAINLYYAAIGTNNGIYITTNSGLLWNQVYNERIYDISMVSANIIYAVAERKIIKTTNGGETWDIIFQPPDKVGMLNYIKAFQDTIITMADSYNLDPNFSALFYKSTDAGVTWNRMNQSSLMGGYSGNIWHRLDFGSPQIGVFHVSGTGTQHTERTMDGGATWNDINLSTIIHNIRMYDKEYGIAFGFYPGGLHDSYTHITRDGGINWELIHLGVPVPSGIGFVQGNPSEVFMGTSSLFFSADSGKTWTDQNFTLLSTVVDIIFVNENCGWVLCSGGDVYWTDNKGNPIVSVKKENKLPTQYALEQNYPNPFNPSTIIKFTLPEAGRVTLKVYDLLGRELKTLIDNEKNAGSHVVTWNGDNYMGQKVSAGIYMYSIVTNKFMQTRKMILLK